MVTLTAEEQKNLVTAAGFEQWPDEEFECFAKCYTHSLSRDITIFGTEIRNKTPQILRDPFMPPENEEGYGPIWGERYFRGTLVDVLKHTIEEIDFLSRIESEKIGCGRDVIAAVCEAALDTELSTSNDEMLEKAGYSLMDSGEWEIDPGEISVEWGDDECYPSLYQYYEGDEEGDVGKDANIWGIIPDGMPGGVANVKGSGLLFEDLRLALEMVIAMMTHTLVMRERKYETYCGVSRMIQKSILPYGWKYHGHRAWNCGDDYTPGGCVGPVEY